MAQLERCIREAGGSLLKRVTLFDVYRGTGVPDGKKSVAFSLELRAEDRTLTDDECSQELSRVLEALEKTFGAVLR